MKIQTQPLPDAAITAQADAARAELAELEATAAQIESEAAKAHDAFEREPSGEAHATVAVCAQRAKNARAKLSQRAGELAPIFAEETRGKQAKRLAELQTTDCRADIEAVATRVVEAYDEFQHVLDAQFAAIARTLEENSRTASEFNTLASNAGIAERRSHVSVMQALEMVRERLHERFGKPNTTEVTRAVVIDFRDLGNSHFVHCAVHLAPNFNHKILQR